MKNEQVIICLSQWSSGLTLDYHSTGWEFKSCVRRNISNDKPYSTPGLLHKIIRAGVREEKHLVGDYWGWGWVNGNKINWGVLLVQIPFNQ